jgi:hypothetical protein
MSRRRKKSAAYLAVGVGAQITQSAPYFLIRATFSAGVPSGTTTVQEIPHNFAALQEKQNEKRKNSIFSR